MRKTAFLVKPLLYLSLLGFASCGVWDFFAAYFNTYYNAKRLYDEAVEEVWAMPETRETGRNMLILPPIGQSTRTKFTSVIEKCSKLLQYHPESNLVDDALLMIGRSYFYQGDYQQADRKFNELIEGYPESNLVPETKVLQAYAYYRIQDVKKAEALATKVFEQASADEDAKTIADISLLLGQLALDAKQYKQAREYYLKVGEMGDMADKRAQAFLKVGEMCSEEGDYDAAERAYLRARSLSGSYIGEYRGSFGAARMKAKQGAYDAALDALIDLRNNANYREFFGEVDVEIGHTYRDQGDLAAAIDQYHYVDTAYARSESAANANYALGMIYENTLHQYDSAKVAYDKGRSAPPQTLLLPQIIRKSDYLGRFLLYNTEVYRLDSTLKVSIAYADSVKRAKRTTPPALPDSLRTAPHGMLAHPDSTSLVMGGDTAHVVSPGVQLAEHLPTGPDTSKARTAPEAQPTPPGPATGTAPPLPADAAGKTPPGAVSQPSEEGRPQTGENAPPPEAGKTPPGAVSQPAETVTSQPTANPPPPSPSEDSRGLTGRAARSRGRIARAQEEAVKGTSLREGDVSGLTSRADSLKPQVPVKPPDPPDSVRKHLATAIDNLAGVLYVSMGKPDSARMLYRRLVAEFPESQVAPRALYVLARIEGEDSTSSPSVPDSLYRLLIEKYPASVFANEARRLIGVPPVQNIADLAEGSYARGTQLLKNGKTLAAIDTFTTLARTFPQSSAASRALYAAGWTYENHTPLRDSAAALYERLVNRYPNTTYAQRVQPRVQEVQAARRLAQEKAKADSLAKAQAEALAKAKADSLAKARADSLAKARPRAPALSDTLKAKRDSLAKAKADTLAKPKPRAPALPDTLKAKADSLENGKSPPGTAPPALPDTLKARTDETDKQEELHEQRRRAKAKPAEPAGKPGQQPDTTKKIPID